ncbi:MAG: bifunctional hydroxymethylpyrimidine kinase/phosphomethylpyrimidine kinase [Desulfovibrio sp.]|jgi:hydroxymethylpyrimidine/phosphomethylpyrimidine kinase|nr:bifunctional hydroxymethylpyrimidine kinase/phosphomethylpyrimidine kinase [Desulfovibrio sp.]
MIPAGAIPRHPVILTVAASDSGGGAGIQADLKTITVLGGFGISVLTALTAQNGAEVRGIHAVPEEFVGLQLQTVRDGFPIRAAKTGMLYSAGIMETLARNLAGKNFPLVADPVCVSQSGCRLLREDAVEALIRHILPLALCLTPNRHEAELLSGQSISGLADVGRAAALLLDRGAQAVLIKGGHFSEYDTEQTITDWLALPGRPLLSLPHPRLDTAHNHGTGCTLSAAAAFFLGQGHSLEDSIRLAQGYLMRALAAGYAPGVGAGSPDFLAGGES